MPMHIPEPVQMITELELETLSSNRISHICDVSLMDCTTYFAISGGLWDLDC